MTTANSMDSVYEFDLPDRLRKTLRHSTMSATEMADYLGVGRETVSRWLNAKTEPSEAIVKLWAIRMGVSYQWLRNGEAPSPDGDGAPDVVRPKGFEPLTSCSGTGVVVACDFGRPAVAAVSSSVGAA